MIDWDITKITKEYFICYPSTRKKVYRICDNCGKGKWIRYCDCRDMCQSCTQKIPASEKTRQKMRDSSPHLSGENHYNYGKHHSEETKKKISEGGKGRIVSEETRKKMVNSRIVDKITLICQQCGVEYKVIPSRKDKSKFCSHECHNKWNSMNRVGKNSPCWKGGDITLICQQCGKDFKVRLSNKNIKFCSKKCHSEYISINFHGKNNPNWKGGFDTTRPYVKPINQCTQLNKRFKGSEGHHIMSCVVVYLPKDLHKSIYHNFKSGKSMKEINKLAMDYLVKNNI